MSPFIIVGIAFVVVMGLIVLLVRMTEHPARYFDRDLDPEECERREELQTRVERSRQQQQALAAAQAPRPIQRGLPPAADVVRDVALTRLADELTDYVKTLKSKAENL
jgi:hypothetical protein